jgi:hypothetical protein
MVVSDQPHVIANLPSGGAPLHFLQGPKAGPGALKKRNISSTGNRFTFLGWRALA